MADLILPRTLAVYDPLGGTPEPLMTGHDGVCVHTMAGSMAGTDAWFHRDGWGGTESTVGVAGSGFCKQWVPWNRQADANLDGNPRWLSIECADKGESFPPGDQGNDGPPLTNAQINKIVDLCVLWCRKESHRNCPSHWTCHKEGIPARFINNSCERGIGVHRHGIEPWRKDGCPKWSGSGGKICPRTVRMNQVKNIIVPRVAAKLSGKGDIDDMPTFAELIKALDSPGNDYREAVGRSIKREFDTKEFTDAVVKAVNQANIGGPFLAWTGDGTIYLVDDARQSKRQVRGWDNVHMESFLGARHDGKFVHSDNKEHPKPFVLPKEYLDSIPIV